MNTSLFVGMENKRVLENIEPLWLYCLLKKYKKVKINI